MKKAKCVCDLFFVKEFNYHDNGCKLFSKVIINTGKKVLPQSPINKQ